MNHTTVPLRVKAASVVLGLSLIATGCTGPAANQKGDAAEQSRSGSKQTDAIAFGPEQRVGRADHRPAWPFLRTAPDGRVSLVWTEDEAPTGGANASTAAGTSAAQHGSHPTSRAAYVAFATDGKSWSEPVRISDMSEAVQGDENETKVAFGADGKVYAAWAVPGDEGNKMKGNIRFSMMTASGTFAPSRILNEVPNAARFPWLDVSPDGTVFVGWLDRRVDNPAPRQVYLSRISPTGELLTENYKIGDDACECCRLTMAFADGGKTVYVAYRLKPKNNIRNIVVRKSTDGGATFGDPVVVSDDGWEIKGCPHSGAVMDTDAKGNLHIIWYTYGQNADESGIYYSASTDGGLSFAPRMLVHAAAGPEVLRSYLAVGQKENLYMAWTNLVPGKDGKEYTQIFFRHLALDSGLLGPVQQLSQAEGNAVWPHVTVAGDKAYVAWTEMKGEESWVVLKTAVIAK